MAFAPILNELCTTLGCSNTEIAQRCGMSMSSLSRYRHGQRTPNVDSPVIAQLAKGITELAKERGVVRIASQEMVEKALRDSLSLSQPLGVSFASRLDGLMRLLSIRNSDIALPLHLDSSYISRIRRGERTPHNKSRIANVCAQVAAMRCMELEEFGSVMNLIGVHNLDVVDETGINLDSVGELTYAMQNWLLGSKVMDSDISSLLELFYKLDAGYYEETLALAAAAEPRDSCPISLAPERQFYRSGDSLWEPELDFLQHALECGAKDVIVSSDMPALEIMMPDDILMQYQKVMAELLGSGCKVTVIHNSDRPLNEALRAAVLWVPLYMTGNVGSLYLSGMHSRMFYHANCVCECCAMTSEAIRGEERDGQYFITTDEEDIAYYRRKMDYVRNRSSVLVEVYSTDDPEQFEVFEREEAQRKEINDRWRYVGGNRFKNLTITYYSSTCVVVALDHPKKFRFVVHHPSLCYAISHL